ncbi:MAG: metallophosphoesterase [Clostridia bacterium]|nr:metallophosphoesterase [Clostridia bacterium]
MLPFVVIAAFLLIAVVVYILSVPRNFTVRKYIIKTDKFSGHIKTVHISDLHNVMWGDGQSELLEKIDEYSPDIAFFTGDIADEYSDTAPAVLMLKEMQKRCMCFYVAGNHERKLENTDDFIATIRSLDITVLEADKDQITVDDCSITVCGVFDPRFYSTEEAYDEKWISDVKKCAEYNENFTVFLSHRPEKAEFYAENGFDLVLCGHAHGGQIRIPGIFNGIYAPHQGLFPKYAGGRYDFDKTTVIVSRGLKKDWLPRTFNPPELVFIDIIGEQ